MNVYQTFPEDGFCDLKMIDPSPTYEFSKRYSSGVSIAAEWPMPLVGYLCADEYGDPDCLDRRRPPSRIGDFPLVSGLVLQPVLTARSFSVLHKMLHPHVEFLPLHSRDGEFTAFRVLRVVDALDKDRSIIKWWPDTKRARATSAPRTIDRVVRYVFREDMLSDIPIFRIPEYSSCTNWFVTDDFRKVVCEAGLQGLGFRLLWPPVDPHTKYGRNIEKHRRKRR